MWIVFDVWTLCDVCATANDACGVIARSAHQSRQRYEEKHAKARELREKLLQDRAERVKALTKKVRVTDVLV